MDRDFWHERWVRGDTAFDQSAPNSLLTTHWSDLGLSDGSGVFVPLCGRSIDLVWLADRGHRVVGVELSEVAVRSFFAERGVEPEVRTEGALTLHRAGPYELWCGDVFDLTATALDGVEAVYDRAGLVALPSGMRRLYGERTAELVPPVAALFVITFEYDQQEMDGPPFSVAVEEVRDLYRGFDLRVVERREVLTANDRLRERGLSGLHEAALVLRPPAADRTDRALP